jgi:hypothetical protein
MHLRQHMRRQDRNAAPMLDMMSCQERSVSRLGKGFAKRRGVDQAGTVINGIDPQSVGQQFGSQALVDGTGGVRHRQRGHDLRFARLAADAPRGIVPENPKRSCEKCRNCDYADIGCPLATGDE